MQRITLLQLAVGMHLAEDVYDQNGILLISKNKKLTEWHIDFLSKNGIGDVAVKEVVKKTGGVPNGLELAFKNSVARFKSVYENITIGKFPIIEEIEDVYEEVLSDIENNPDILEVFLILDSFEKHIYEHSVMVSMVAGLISTWLGKDEKETKKAIFAGLFHDIGKSNVPFDLLSVNRELKPSELNILKMHPTFSYTLAKDVFSDEAVLDAIRNHHERIDGSGYPRGLEGKEISELTSIVGVADIYANRVRPSMTKVNTHPLNVLSELKEVSLHPKVISTFINNTLPKFLGLQVQLSNGENAEIIKLKFENPSRPVVKTQGKLLDLASDNKTDILFILGIN